MAKDAKGHGSNARGGAAAHQNGVHAAVPDAGTVDRYGVTPQSGYMVGGALDSRYTGYWTDQATGQHYVEKSTRVNSETLARSMGRMRNQISVYDLRGGREIKTGGTGVYTPR